MRNVEARQKLYKNELECRIDWLSDHIKRMESVPMMRVPVTLRELMRKRQLLLELKCGLPVSGAEVRSRTNVARVLRSSAPLDVEYISRPIKSGEFNR
jgi:hypothetical protein